MRIHSWILATWRRLHGWAIARVSPVYPLGGPYRGRHETTRRAAIAEAHRGATADWSPTAELARVDCREPEELLAEAAEREADQIADYWADMEAQFADDVHAEFEASWAQMEPLHAAVADACRAVVAADLNLSDDEAEAYLARFAQINEATGEYAVVRELVAA